MKPIHRAAAVLAVVLVSAACTQTPAVHQYDLGPLPNTNLELGWWATVTKVETPPHTVGAPQTAVDSVPSDVLFAEDRCELTPAADSTIEALATEIKDRDGKDVTVVGHTDHLGDDAYNDRLGKCRADAVISSLASHGVDPARIKESQTAGKREPQCSETRPDGTDDPDCRARDRRVTLSYTYTATDGR